MLAGWRVLTLSRHHHSCSLPQEFLHLSSGSCSPRSGGFHPICDLRELGILLPPSHSPVLPDGTQLIPGLGGLPLPAPSFLTLVRTSL